MTDTTTTTTGTTQPTEPTPQPSDKAEAEHVEGGEEEEEVDWTQLTEADLELKSFHCPRCEKEFSTTNDLFQHMREAYDDPTVCQLCGKNLNCMANILSHSYLHQGIKPYKCPKCKYETRTRFNLRVHFGSCAKIEKFEYKRGHTNKKRKLTGAKRGNAAKRRRTKSKNSRKNAQSKQTDLDAFVVGDDAVQLAEHNSNPDGINYPNYHYDLFDALANLEPCTANRDESCLIQVHVQFFPRANLTSATQAFYPADPAQFYPEQNHNQTQQEAEQIQFTVSDIAK